jgi:hypothetical protein
MTCKPMGIPRSGTRRRIFHTANDITFFYPTSASVRAAAAQSATRLFWFVVASAVRRTGLQCPRHD